MPWKASDAERHTKKADTSKSKKQWSKVANGELKSGKSEGAAVKIANGVVKKQMGKGAPPKAMTTKRGKGGKAEPDLSRGGTSGRQN